MATNRRGHKPKAEVQRLGDSKKAKRSRWRGPRCGGPSATKTGPWRFAVDTLALACEVPQVTDSGNVSKRIAAVRERAAAGQPLHGLDLRGLSLTAKDLASDVALDFEGADLRGCTFLNADLTKASFFEADLSGAAFHQVTLAGADLRHVVARGAMFTDVNLAYARFTESDLRGTLFFDANMADISFKGAKLDGSEVDAVRLSLNGCTHVLGLKEALRSLAEVSSYPYIAGVSADAFWLSYFTKTRDINWGSFAKDALRRGLENFGYPCWFADEVEEDDAWDALTSALADGATVITPLHVSASTVLGTGFGGAEWVFVTGIDRGEVLVNCMLGDGLRFSRDRFRAGWCQHHPLEEAADDLPVIYAMCVIGTREQTPSRAESTRAGLRGALEVMSLPGTERVIFGFDAYQQMVQDLSQPRSPRDLPPDEARRFLPWLGLGIKHHHGSRWAVRDFLDEVLDQGDFNGPDRDALAEARDLYHGACLDLLRFLEIMPWTFDLENEAEKTAAFGRYEKYRGQGGDLLRAAAAKERDALERFRAVVTPG